ncbi:hypothetical protein GCM10023237_03760 [Streptomyces coeruleoprunus]
MDDLQQALRDAARAHRPDRARILARVERGMAAPPAAERPGGRRPFAAPWLRVAGATTAVAAVLAVGGYAAGTLLNGDHGPATTAVPPATTAVPPPTAASPAPPAATPPGPAPTATSPRPGPPPSASAPATRPTGGPTVPTSTPTAQALRTRDGHLSGQGAVDPHSNRFWAQSNITFTSAAPLGALTVELRVVQTGGVADTGNWRSLPADDFTVSVREEAGVLVYTWTLRPGRTAPEGQHVFAGQYNHAEGGRDARGDRWTVTATATDGRKARVGGAF